MRLRGFHGIGAHELKRQRSMVKPLRISPWKSWQEAGDRWQLQLLASGSDFCLPGGRGTQHWLFWRCKNLIDSLQELPRNTQQLGWITLHAKPLRVAFARHQHGICIRIIFQRCSSIPVGVRQDCWNLLVGACSALGEHTCRILRPFQSAFLVSVSVDVL